MNKNSKKQEAIFEDKLYLYKYFLSLLGVKSIDDKKIKILNDANYEEIDEYINQSKYYNYLLNIISNKYKSKLKSYDDNIIEYLTIINKKRFNKIRLKYFQYLSILFTEIFLDEYYNNRVVFIDDLNNFITNYIADFNKNNENIKINNKIQITKDNFNKLAFMNATGSGKTIIFHINYLQMKKYGVINKFQNILLITKNERLSRQHLEELHFSSISAHIFDGKNYDKGISIIDINKLQENAGPETFDYKSFSNSNLIFVDEAHSGLKGSEWKKRRDSLVSIGGFSFEYSATLKEAIDDKNTDLVNEYEEAILFDYSYKYFKNDGYGKDYQILNLPKAIDLRDNTTYLTGCLLTYYEQLKYYETNIGLIKDFLIEKPLLVFVGTTVTSSVSDDNPDVVKIIKFFEKFVSNKKDSIKNIKLILDEKSGIHIENDESNIDVFKGKFKEIKKIYNYENSDDKKLLCEKIFNDILIIVFNYSYSSISSHLSLYSIKSDDDEIGIKVGDSEFGLISVGDVAGLLKLLKEEGINVQSSIKVPKSLFGSIGNKNSKTNVLIGSKKFIEGWNNYRVSTMGLINFAKSKGSEAIQLFGRGVRLKGYDFSLKRSSCLDEKYHNIKMNIPNGLEILETLNVFGLQSDYMVEFREFLNKYGIDSANSDNGNIVVKNIPVFKTFDNIKKKHLRILRVKKGVDFEKDSEPIIFKFNKNDGFYKYITNELNKVQLHFITYVQNSSSIENELANSDSNGNIHHLNDYCITKNLSVFDYIDFDKIYFNLIEYKMMKKYYKIIITKEDLINIIKMKDWYYIEIQESKLEINSKEDISHIEKILLDLLHILIDKFYKWNIKLWENNYLEYQDLDDNDENFIKNYQISFLDNEKSKNDNVNEIIDDYIKQLNDIIDTLKNDKNIKYVPKGKEKGEQLKNIPNISNCFAIFSPEHLYKPLMSLYGRQGYLLKVQPVGLNQYEYKFVDLLLDFKYNKLEKTNLSLYDSFIDEHRDILGDKVEIYLLRNIPKKGIGFFEANNFYPDFILWLETDNTQYINFIDPKGIHNLGLNNDKIQFCRNVDDLNVCTIKNIQHKLENTNKENKNIILNAFILSDTKKKDLDWWDEKKVTNDKYNIIFMYDDNDDAMKGNINCINYLFDKIIEK